MILDIVHITILNYCAFCFETMFTIVTKNIIHGNIPERDVYGLGTAQTNFSGFGSESESTTEVAALFIMGDYLETLFFGELHIMKDYVYLLQKETKHLGEVLGYSEGIS